MALVVENLYKRDVEQLVQIWQNDKQLPQIPSKADLEQILAKYAKESLKRTFGVFMKQLQEYIAIKKLDPWYTFFQNSGLPVILRSDSSNLAIRRYMRFCNPNNKDSTSSPVLKRFSWNTIDIAALGTYIALLFSLIPVICLHYFLKPIPPKGWTVIIIIVLLIVLIVASLQIWVHAGADYDTRNFTLTVIDGSLDGLCGFNWQLQDTNTDTVGVVLVWRKIDIKINFNVVENVPLLVSPMQKVKKLNVTLRNCTFPINFSLDPDTDKYKIKCSKVEKWQAAIHATSFRLKEIHRSQLSIESIDTNVNSDEENSFFNVFESIGGTESMLNVLFDELRTFLTNRINSLKEAQ